jgi:hypothetical protein
MTVRADGKKTPCLVECGLVPDRRQYIEHFAFVGRCVTDAIGRKQRQMQRPRYVDGCPVSPLLFAIEVSLELDVDILRTEDRDKPFDLFTRSANATSRKRRGQRPFLASGKADQALVMLFDIGKQGCALGLLSGAQFVPGDQTAEILVAGA